MHHITHLKLLAKHNQKQLTAIDSKNNLYFCIYNQQNNSSDHHNLKLLPPSTRIIHPLPLQTHNHYLLQQQSAHPKLSEIYQLPKSTRTITSIIDTKSEVYRINFVYDFIFNVVEPVFSQLAFCELSDQTKQNLQQQFIQCLVPQNLLIVNEQLLYILAKPRNKSKSSNQAGMRNILAHTGKLFMNIFQCEYNKNFLHYFLEALTKHQLGIKECRSILTDIRQRKKFVSSKKNSDIILTPHYWNSSNLKSRIKSNSVSYYNTIDIAETKAHKERRLYTEECLYNKRGVYRRKSQKYGLFRESQLQLQNKQKQKYKASLSEKSSYKSIDSYLMEKIGPMKKNSLSVYQKAEKNEKQQSSIQEKMVENTLLKQIRKKMSSDVAVCGEKGKKQNMSHSICTEIKNRKLPQSADKQVRELLIRKFQRQIFVQRKPIAQNFSRYLNLDSNEISSYQNPKQYDNKVQQEQKRIQQQQDSQKMFLQQLRQQIDKCVEEKLGKLTLNRCTMGKQISIQTDVDCQVDRQLKVGRKRESKEKKIQKIYDVAIMPNIIRTNSVKSKKTVKQKFIEGSKNNESKNKNKKIEQNQDSNQEKKTKKKMPDQEQVVTPLSHSITVEHPPTTKPQSKHNLSQPHPQRTQKPSKEKPQKLQSVDLQQIQEITLTQNPKKRSKKPPQQKPLSKEHQKHQKNNKRNITLTELSSKINQYIQMVNMVGQTAAKSSSIANKLKKLDWFPGVYFMYKRFYHQRIKLEKYLHEGLQNCIKIRDNEIISPQIYKAWAKSNNCVILREQIAKQNTDIKISLAKMHKKLLKKYQSDLRIQKYSKLDVLVDGESAVLVEFVVGEFDTLEEQNMLDDPQIMEHISEMIQSLQVIAQLDNKKPLKKQHQAQSIKNYLHRNLPRAELQQITEQIYALYEQ